MTLKHGVNTLRCHEKQGAYEKRRVRAMSANRMHLFWSKEKPASDPDLLESYASRGKVAWASDGVFPYKG